MNRDNSDQGNSVQVALRRSAQCALYCALSSGFMAAILASVAGFNYRMNPLDYFDHRASESPTFANPRLTKSLLPQRDQPRSIVVGSSRPELAISTEHPGWSHRPVLNLALSGTTIDEMAAYFEHACLEAPVRVAVVFLDYDSCNLSAQAQPTYRADRLRRMERPPSVSAKVNDLHAALLSWRAFESSAWIASGRRESDYLPTGQRDEHRHYDKILASGGVLRASERTLRAFPRVPSGSDDYHWRPLRRMIRTANELNVNVIWIFTPLHDTIWRNFVQRDGLETVLQWRKRVLEVLQSEADRCGMGQQVCWDFDHTPFMRMTMEEVVEEVQLTDLPLFYEYSHFSSRVGDLILDRVLSDSGSDDFGTPLTVGAVDDRLTQLAVAWRCD